MSNTYNIIHAYNSKGETTWNGVTYQELYKLVSSRHNIKAGLDYLLQHYHTQKDAALVISALRQLRYSPIDIIRLLQVVLGLSLVEARLLYEGDYY